MSAHPTPDSDVIQRELAIEQAHIDAVYARLEEATRSAEQVATEGRSLFQSDRSSFVREEDGTGLFERDVFAFQSAKRLAILDAEHEGLVFGRLDRTDGEVRYVGRIGVRDEEYEPLVIDWRARAAEPFYRATPTEPMEVVRRRVLRCRGDQVVGIEDDLLDSDNADTDLVVVGEGALMAALSRSRGRQMRDIVATIQSEQDEAIRAPYQGVTVIAGGPGTGKTVVALHRAAYLLYSHRRRFENGGVLVVGPSRVFMNYIERVLPSLGEESVTLRAIGSVPSDVLGFRAERVDPADLHAIKGSTRMLPVLRKLVNEPLAKQSPEQARLRVVVKGEVLILPSEELSRIRNETLRHHKLNQARSAAEKAVLGALWERKPDEVDLERAEFDDLVTDQAAHRLFMQAWWPSLSAVQVLARLADRELTVRLSEGILSAAEAERLSASYAEHADWSVADSALLDELTAILGPVVEETEPDPLLFLADGSEIAEVVTTADRTASRREIDPFADAHDTYAHVLVDEAQDITPMQWRMLRRRGSHASWTIVGDPAQSSWPSQAESAAAVDTLIGRAPSRRFRMSTNYRSPAEVFELASRVVSAVDPDADLPRAIRHTDVEPRLLATPADEFDRLLVNEVSALARQVDGTIGVIAPPSRIAHVNQVLGHSALAGLADRISVITPLESKGLEYDAVLVVSPDEIIAESPGGVRVLYVALTRPTQRLVTIDVSADAAPGTWRQALD